MAVIAIATVGFGVLGANLAVNVTGEITYQNSGVDLTFTTTDAAWPGTYTITAAQLAALDSGVPQIISFKAPTGLSNPPVAGDVVSAQTPLVVWRTADGSPDVTLKWMGVLANAATSYTLTVQDLDDGVNIEWTATNSGGAITSTQQVTEEAIWQTFVQASGNSFLTAPAGVIEDDFTQGTLFLSFDAPAGDWDLLGTHQRPFRLFSQAGTTNERLFHYSTTSGTGAGLFSIQWRTDQSPLNGLIYDNWAGQGMNVLFRYDHPNISVAVQNSDGSWISHTIGGASATAFRGGPLQIFPTTDQGVKLRRVAWWTGVAADVTSGAVRDLFASASGSLVSPATSRASLGAPLVDLYGRKADWDAGTNNGSIGNFTVTGSFVEV